MILSQSHPIPGRLNIAILAGAIAAAAGALWIASHLAAPWPVAAAVAYSFVNNTIFSLLHEAVHGVFHPNSTINRWAGRLAACFFPTAFSVQRAFHLTHHRYNRTEFEQFDLVRPNDNRLLKIVQWYSILSGLYGLSPTLFCLLYPVVPGLFRLRWWARPDQGIGHQTSGAIYFGAIAKVPIGLIRQEVALALAVQGTLAWSLDLSLAGWALCHLLFAVNWSALQYADHAFSPLDPVEGAWNLRVSAPVRWLFLNYHYHRVHHRYPQLPWLYLPAMTRPNEPQPSFWRIYLRMWLGPRRYDPSTADDKHHAA